MSIYLAALTIPDSIVLSIGKYSSDTFLLCNKEKIRTDWYTKTSSIPRIILLQKILQIRKLANLFNDGIFVKKNPV